MFGSGSMLLMSVTDDMKEVNHTSVNGLLVVIAGPRGDVQAVSIANWY